MSEQQNIDPIQIDGEDKTIGDVTPTVGEITGTVTPNQLGEIVKALYPDEEKDEEKK